MVTARGFLGAYIPGMGVDNCLQKVRIILENSR